MNNSISDASGLIEQSYLAFELVKSTRIKIMNGHATQPAKVPTDTVIPLHTLDDASFYKRMVTSITFQFNDVLDPDRLRLALERLLSMEGWTKLGGRLRKNVSVCVAFQAQEQATRV